MRIATKFFKSLCLGVAVLSSLSINAVEAARLKDIASIQGIRENQLLGYGLVVGLAGTGEKNSKFTEQSFRSMLNNFGIKIDESTSLKIKDVAPVAIHATMPPFSKTGQTIDVTVSAIGEATSLRVSRSTSWNSSPVSAVRNAEMAGKISGCSSGMCRARSRASSPPEADHTSPCNPAMPQKTQ